jgi:NADH:ubiquinone oxidoreductase subunit 2 (subunit N)
MHILATIVLAFCCAVTSGFLVYMYTRLASAAYFRSRKEYRDKIEKEYKIASSEFSV